MASVEGVLQKLRGYIFIIIGILLILYTLGYVQKIGSAILITVSLFLIVLGFIDAGFYRMISKKVQPPQ